MKIFLRLVYCAVAVFLIFTMVNCSNRQKKQSTEADTKTRDAVVVQQDTSVIPGSFKENSGLKFDSSAIGAFLKTHPQFNEFGNDYLVFYRQNKFNYVWYDHKGLIESSGALLSRLDNENQEGVQKEVPYEKELMELVHNGDSINRKSADLNTELLLTGSYFYYAKKIYTGDVSALKVNWFIPKKKLSYGELLAENLTDVNFDSIENQVLLPQYANLRSFLKKYRDLEAEGGLKEIPSLPSRTVLKLKDSSGTIGDVRNALFKLGYLKTNNNSAVFDAEMTDAVNFFRQSIGLKADSTISSSVISALNVPLQNRIRQIMVNMERFRWLPGQITSPDVIVVNIPEFVLHYYESGKEVWQCDVVVGTPMTKTVIFTGDMQYIIFSPYWYVPQSIINKEVKPGMARNPNYLASHRMEWNGGNVRQLPGSSNSLCLVKFICPNSNDIYLHDTPAKSLSGEDKRAFSHGCARVSKPKDLAVRILRNDPAWTPETIEVAMHKSTETRVTLKQRVPVYIGYWTAFVDKNGHLNFRDDVYDRDNNVLEMLMAAK